jgi:hypothetical protein
LNTELGKRENTSGILVKIMNKIYETGKVPSGWKTSMIYKGKGNEENPANYRGISLLSTISKIYTGALARRLNGWAERKDTVTEFQMGFRKGRRTTDNIFILRTIVDKYLARKRGKIYWIFVDLQKAFDTVIREALWWKLSKEGISTAFIEGIKAIGYSL